MPTKRWNSLPSESLTELPVHQQYLAYADAYLDSADRLCRILAVSYRKASFQRGAVVLYMVQHALELFYKGAILRKKPAERLSHGVSKLRARYLSLYPSKECHVRATFVSSYENLTKEEREYAMRHQPPGDQLFRYPEDKTGNPWSGLYTFEASSFCKEIAGLKSEFASARAKIDA